MDGDSVPPQQLQNVLEPQVKLAQTLIGAIDTARLNLLIIPLPFGSHLQV